MDAAIQSLIDAISTAGFTVQFGTSRRHLVVDAINERTGEQIIVRGDDLHETIVKLARQVGVEVDDD